MKKTKHRARRFVPRPAFGALAVFVLLYAVPATAIQFPNNLFIPATGCSNPAILGVPCTGTSAAPGYLDTNFVVAGSPHDPRAVYRYFAATDGAALMADGTPLYTFGFVDLTNVPLSYITGTVPVASNAYLGVTGAAASVSPVSITETGIPQKLLPPGDTSANAEVTFQGKANWIAPDLVFNEGDHVYLNLVNLGMRERMDLPDAHSIHWHGQPNAAPQFDGEPMASWGINMSLVPVPTPISTMPKTPEARDFTYFVNASHPGTFLFHCHVEASEHMEMGMLGHLIVRPRQNGTPETFNGRTYTTFAYNDCPAFTPGLDASLCGTTGYDVEMFLQLADFDPAVHANDATYGALAPNFVLFTPAYPMMNGRGYPDTLRPDNDPTFLNNMSGITFNPTTQPPAANYVSQKKSSLITINKTGGQRTALVRLTDLSVQVPYNLRSEIPMRVVGKDANLLAGPTGTDLTYGATSVFIGPGETYDFILDVTNVPTGTYFLYARELNRLNNNVLDRGGIMTEIHVN